MQSKFVEVTPRSFNPMSVPGLSNDAREAVNAALKAMSAWRNETADTSQKNSKQVIEKMATAAAALGWPEQIVDAARAQMQTITEMQIKTWTLGRSRLSSDLLSSGGSVEGKLGPANRSSHQNLAQERSAHGGQHLAESLGF